jgi:hypothetical protein
MVTSSAMTVWRKKREKEAGEKLEKELQTAGEGTEGQLP